MKNLLVVAVWLLSCVGLPAFAELASNYEQELQRHIATTLNTGCVNPQSELARVLCNKRLRVGVRANYKLFGEFDGTHFKGFEVDLTKTIAKHLGVQAELIVVNPANRIEKLKQGDIDAIIATMAHTVSRETSIYFIRPHYYASPTTIVGAKGQNISGWHDLKGKTVCVPLGNFSNIVFSEHRVKLLIYDRPNRLIDALEFGACSIIAHDRSLLNAEVFGPDAPKNLSNKFEEKFSFDTVPWGIGVQKEAKDDLGAALSFIMAHLHQSGTLEKLARQHGVDIQFLADQYRIFKDSNCLTQHQLNPSCLGAPADISDKPTPIAPQVHRFERWLNEHARLSLKFPMLVGENAARIFIIGVLVSLLLVTGSIFATMGITLLFFKILQSKHFLFRLLGQIVTQFFQSSPIILLLTLGYLIVSYLTSYSPPLAILVSVTVIGLNNGANAGSAMSELAASSKKDLRILVIASKARIQFRAAVINAAKASPVAGFIGAPELLAVLTDITAFSGERITTFLILIIFYLILIQLVIILSERLSQRLDKYDAYAS
jgi:ABC-type amino acid transport substrate-binding protein/ABC-type amino acid transport system permease subunit